VVQIDETSVLVSWLTNIPSDSRVLFDTRSVTSLGAAPDYGYARSTASQNDLALYHSVVVSGLSPQTLYAFRPVSRGNGHETLGPEIRFAPLFKTAVASNLQCPAVPTTPAQTVTSAPQPKPQSKAKPAPAKVPPSAGMPEGQILRILEILKQDRDVLIKGQSAPGAKLKIRIY